MEPRDDDRAPHKRRVTHLFARSAKGKIRGYHHAIVPPPIVRRVGNFLPPLRFPSQPESADWKNGDPLEASRAIALRLEDVRGARGSTWRAAWPTRSTRGSCSPCRSRRC